MYEVEIVDGKGMRVKGPVTITKEDVALPDHVKKRIVEAKRKTEEETP